VGADPEFVDVEGDSLLGALVVPGDVGEGMCVGDGAGVGEVEVVEKVEKIVEFPIVSIVGGVFCHRTDDDQLPQLRGSHLSYTATYSAGCTTGDVTGQGGPRTT
jgi:hypothetical protein